MLKNRIKTLIGLIEDTEIDEIEVSSFWGIQKIRLSKASKKLSVTNDIKENISRDDAENVSYEDNDKEVIIENPSSEIINDEISTSSNTESSDDINVYEMKAPLVGTFYSSPKPTDPPFVNVGDKVSKGQVICIIEAMKIFNDIESDITGTVHEICVENGSPVEFDQLIIKILPE
tara:strand:- start:91 stop:615 length:525 start_codon:yes stop_codon:yes gene_type:complete